MNKAASIEAANANFRKLAAVGFILNGPAALPPPI
jgi:hypothetical protein